MTPVDRGDDRGAVVSSGVAAATFVVPDAHGNGDVVRELLEREGIIEQDWTPDGFLATATRVMGRDKVTVVSLGDLANCVASSTGGDLDALDLVHCGLIDVLLVGNHEHPYFGGPRFSGFWPDEDVRRSLLALNDRGRVKAAYAAGNVLVSHAGFTSYWLRDFGGWNLTAAQLAERANEKWGRIQQASIFSGIGRRRGGYDTHGGILWADWDEPKPRHLRQIVGHTVAREVRHRSAATCIDLGAGKHGTKVAGAWISHEGIVDIVVHDLSEPDEAAA